MLDPTYSGQRIGTHTTESGTMRGLVKVFDAEKKEFSNSRKAIKLDLPKPLDTLSIGDAVVEGELTVPL